MLTLDFHSIHPSFREFFDAEKDVLSSILEKISASPHCPDDALVFRFASFDLSSARVVILGQDPYPQPGAATGRSFEVAGLTSWLAPFRQVSLKNILRAIYKSQTGELLPFSEIRHRIEDGRFPILPPDRLFDSLEAQGVLFLNAYLTCRPGEPLSHRALWRGFAERLLAYIDRTRPGLSYFLWGADARSFANILQNGILYESRHPMMCTDHPDDFLSNPCFYKTSSFINWLGSSAVSG